MLISKKYTVTNIKRKYVVVVVVVAAVSTTGAARTLLLHLTDAVWSV